VHAAPAGKENKMQSRRRWIAIVALGLSVFMITVDMSSVALALPAMGHAFQQPDAAMTAVIVSYTLPLTLLILPAGLVLSRWPALPTFLVGVLGFAATGALGAFAPSLGCLIGCRVAQSVFGALLAPLGIALAVQVVAPHERGRAMGLLASIGPLGSVAGPGIGGLVLGTWGWPSIFLINVPISIIAAVLALVSMRGIPFARQRLSGLASMPTSRHQASHILSFGGRLLTPGRPDRMQSSLM
jgi:MFS family permease